MRAVATSPGTIDTGSKSWPAWMKRVRLVAVPFLAGTLALGTAVVGALLVGGTGTGGVNGFVESLSGSSSSNLGELGLLAPLGFAFAVGMASAVNPCGFAMLPAYLGLYLGTNEQGTGRRG